MNRLLSRLRSGEISVADLSDMLIENRLLVARGQVTELFRQIHDRIIKAIIAGLESTGNISMVPQANKGLSGLGGFWDDIKSVAETVYDTGSKAVSTIGEFIKIGEPGSGVININLPEVDQALEEVREKGLVRIETGIPESILGVPTWVLPVALIGIFGLLLLRR
jgi:hypothetical protein